MEDQVLTGQAKKQNLYNRAILARLGVEIEEHENVDRIVLFWWDSIKRFAPYLVRQNSKQDMEIVVNWIKTESDKNKKHALHELEKLTSFIFPVSGFATKWSYISSELKRERTGKAIGTIEKLIDLLENSDFPNASLGAMQYFSDCCNVFGDMDVMEKLKDVSISKKLKDPYEIGITEILAAVSIEMKRLSTTEKIDNRPEYGDVERRVLSRDIASYLKRTFNVSKNPNVVIAALLRMIYQDESIDAQKVQGWTKKRT
jgi:hypothetical protein